MRDAAPRDDAPQNDVAARSQGHIEPGGRAATAPTAPAGLYAAGRALRPVLDAIYNGCGALAALFLVAILVIILAQIVARWAGLQFPGSTSYAGYCMAAASFFAFAYTLNHGGHIRVSLFVRRLTGLPRRLAELWCFGVGAGLAWYFAFYAVKAIRVSYKINDVSQGQDATPLWIPQLSMGIGTVVLALALTDHLVRILFGGSPDLGDEAESSVHTE